MASALRCGLTVRAVGTPNHVADIHRQKCLSGPQPSLQSSFVGRKVTVSPHRPSLQPSKKQVACSAKLVKPAKAAQSAVEIMQRDLQLVGDVVKKAAKALQKPAVAAMLAAVVLSGSPDAALAAGGGRVGGKVSSGSSRSYSAPSQTYSAPSGGYSGYSGGGFAAPYFAPSPFAFGSGFGYGFSPFSFFAPPVVVGGGGGGGLFSFLVFGLLAFFVVNAVTRAADGGILTGGDKISVCRLQVGLLGLARGLQRDLDRIAERADTSTAEGLHYVLTETSLALMRHPDYCVYGRASTDVKNGSETAESLFNQMSLEERGKFEQETLVNVNSLRKRFSMAPKEDRMNNEFIVVTILVAAEGNYKLPAVNSAADLRQALSVIGSIPTESVQAVELLWTPQDANDTLTETEMLRDYPALRPL